MCHMSLTQHGLCAMCSKVYDMEQQYDSGVRYGTAKCAQALNAEWGQGLLMQGGNVYMGT
jgi:hypothetical protein